MRFLFNYTSVSCKPSAKLGYGPLNRNDLPSFRLFASLRIVFCEPLLELRPRAPSCVPLRFLPQDSKKQSSKKWGFKFYRLRGWIQDGCVSISHSKAVEANNTRGSLAHPECGSNWANHRSFSLSTFGSGRYFLIMVIAFGRQPEDCERHV